MRARLLLDNEVRAAAHRLLPKEASDAETG
jgi:hypothetical protein